jgi:diguanylate cyclase (GGDEF)-like protein/PAS domain S-box-containing protein
LLQLEHPIDGADQASAQRLRELTFLAAMVRAIATSQDHDAVLRSIIEQTTGATNTQVCSLYIWDEDEQRLVLTATNGLAPEAVGAVKLALGEGITGWVGLHRQPLAVEDVRQDPRFVWVPNVDDGRFTSMLSVPIVLGDRLLGVLNVQTNARRVFAPDEIDFFAAIAAQLGGVVEITGLHRQLALAEALRASQERYQQIVETAWEGIWTFDAGGRTKYVNQRLCAMLGYSAAELSGQPVHAFAPDDWGAELQRRLERLHQGASEQYDMAFTRKDGTTLWAIVSASPVRDRHGQATEFLTMLADVSARKDAEEALKHQAAHDALTGLPNRPLLQDRLEQALRTAPRDNVSVALLLLDLDRFKEVNDSLGHPAGDEVLRQVAQRLQQLLRASDTVARLGGDEFALVLPGATADDAAVVAAKAIRALQQPLTIEGQVIEIGGSIGMVVFPEHGRDVDTLVRRADVAMYAAKREAGGYAFYLADQDEDFSARLTLAAELRQALAHEAFELHYQPKISIGSGQVTSVEALVRWRHPTRGLLPPSAFVAVAEQTGLVRPLFELVLRQAIQQGQAWRAAGIALTVAVNLSMRNLQDDALPARVERLLAELGGAPDWLSFEITECMLMTNPDHTIPLLRQLDALGIRLSIDDFGTGYSSLAHLARLPVSEIKIDRSFVADMETNATNMLVVRSIVDLAHNLGLRVVAEGVERPETLDYLARLGCDEAQGYLIARPLPPPALAAWLTSR